MGEKGASLHPHQVERLRLHLIGVRDIHHPDGDEEAQLRQPPHQPRAGARAADDVEGGVPRRRRLDGEPGEERDIGPPRHGVLPHLHVGAVGDADAGLGDDLLGPALGEHLAAGDEQQQVAVLAGEVEVVHDHDGRQLPRGREPPGEVEHLDLVVDVEVGGGLVHEEHGWAAARAPWRSCSAGAPLRRGR